MVFLEILDITFPLKNPVLLFALILFIILFAPILLNKFKIPPLIGLIIAGAIIGPNGLNLMQRDSSIILFGTVGLLYIMFLAGIEMDIGNFKKNSGKSLVFGIYTFAIPIILGYIASRYFLNFSVLASVLMASMFASHTLIAYPIVSQLGVAKNRAVNVTIGGTMITDTLALLVLAVIVGMSTGEISNGFWIKLIISVIVFGIVVVLGFPMLARWFFKRYDDHISQYIFVLGMVFLAAFLAEAAGIEAIIGAFLAGLALNRLIPQTSPLMNRIEFVGNALFIPFFLIGVGMLVDFKAFFKDLETIKVAITMTVVATVAKFGAAWLQHPMHYPANNEGLMELDKAQLKELFTQYGNIDIIFFDGPAEGLKEYVWQLQPNVVVTRGQMQTPEQKLPDKSIPGPWEACFTMGTDWQYKPTNDPHKTGTEIINMLIEIRAKGGNLLMNVGPKPDGEIQIEQEALLREVALWNLVNEEGISSIRPWEIIKEGDIWFTKAKNSNTIYAFVQSGKNWKYGDRKEFVFKTLEGDANTKVSILGYASELLEYKNGFDTKIYISPTPIGLVVSAVNGHRLYTNNQWPNPVVMKIENVKFKQPAQKQVKQSTIDGAK